RRRSCLQLLSRNSLREEMDFHHLIPCMCNRTETGIPACFFRMEAGITLFAKFHSTSFPCTAKVGGFCRRKTCAARKAKVRTFALPNPNPTFSPPRRKISDQVKQTIFSLKYHRAHFPRP